MRECIVVSWDQQAVLSCAHVAACSSSCSHGINSRLSRGWSVDAAHTGGRMLRVLQQAALRRGDVRWAYFLHPSPQNAFGLEVSSLCDSRQHHARPIKIPVH
jgi:hypothetical protein